jgi:hypothetical protein
MPNATGMGCHFIFVSARALRSRVLKESLYSLFFWFNLAEEENDLDLQTRLTCGSRDEVIERGLHARACAANTRDRVLIIVTILGSDSISI